VSRARRPQAPSFGTGSAFGSANLVLEPGVRGDEERSGESFAHEKFVDEDSIFGSIDVGEKAVVIITCLDIADDIDEGPNRKEFGQAT